MRNLIAWVFGLWLALATGVLAQSTAQSGPVVVELFTSQGCSSCPPADELLGELARLDNVIALSLHVDYWDYIGWKDQFADPKYTKRQKAYARAAGKRMVYTPQMIIAGEDHLVGTKPRELKVLLGVHSSVESPVKLAISREGDQVAIKAEASEAGIGKMVVQLVRYSEGETVKIRRGENAGRALAYHNIVTEWSVLENWDGASKLSLTAKAAGDDAVVVIVQRVAHGPILAAARLR